VLQPLAVFVTDEDCNGLVVHVVNEANAASAVTLELQLFRLSMPVGAALRKELLLDPASSTQLAAIDLFDGFMDLSYSFRFGPPAYDVMRVAVSEVDGRGLLAETFHFPQGLPNVIGMDVGLSAAATPAGEAWHLNIQCKGFAQSVNVQAPGFVADDQYFHMAPNTRRMLTLKARTPAAKSPEGAVHALNAAAPSRIVLS
jgi:beta-mannosidase